MLLKKLRIENTGGIKESQWDESDYIQINHLRRFTEGLYFNGIGGYLRTGKIRRISEG
jgi:hypothetical protein